MINSKLLQFFQILSGEDLRQVQKMLKSPFFTSNENLQTLFNLLRRQHPNFEEKAVHKEKVFAKVFPNHLYTELKLRNLMTDLVKLIEQYFVLAELDKNSFLQGKLLTTSLLQKNSLPLADTAANQVLKKLENEPFCDDDFYYHQYEFLKIKKKIIQLTEPVHASVLLKESRNALLNAYKFADIKLVTELMSVTGFLPTLKLENDAFALQNNNSYLLYKEVSLLIENNDLSLFLVILIY